MIDRSTREEPLTSFNGAAADQRRKCHCGREYDNVRSGFNGAAADQRRKSQPELDNLGFGGRASMEPPLISGGNAKSEHVDVVLALLQWSRR